MDHLSWRTSLLLIVLSLLLGGWVRSSQAAFLLPSPYQTDSLFSLAGGDFSPLSGSSTAPDGMITEHPRLPTAGALIFDDFVKVETDAYNTLKNNKDFRVSISPHLGKDNFDTLVKQFDYEAGFDRTVPDSTDTIQQKLDTADSELRRARDMYAFLAVYANESRFRERYPADCDSSKEDVVAGTVDRCNFGARMRESVREVAYLRMIFGQQFTADAMGLHFSGDVIGGEEFVRDEVRKLEMATTQYQIARDAVAEGMHVALGSGCYVSDFYSQSEWALLSRAVEGLERAQHHIAVRKSYLDDSGPTEAQLTYRAAAMNQYIEMIGTAGLNVRSPAQQCAKGTPPNGDDDDDGDMIARMVANMLATRQSSTELREGRNVFGFDVHFTPARPYRTAVGSKDTGLWDEAMTAAELAKRWQDDDVAASRHFDNNKQQLMTAIGGVKQSYDTRLGDLTGCRRNSFPSDDAYFKCVDSVATRLQLCSFDSQDQPGYEACVAQVPAGLLRQQWEELRAAYLRTKRVKASIDDMPRRVEIEVGKNAKVKHTVWTAGQAQAADQFFLGLVQSLSVSIGSSGGSVSFNPESLPIAEIQRLGTLRAAAKEMEINDANSEAVVRNLLLELGELQIDLEVAAQEFNAHATQFQSLAAEAKDLAIEARRARAYLQQSPANDPSFRLVRDSARLRLASQLEYAARVSYMAAKRAEYEYAARLSASNFRISDIYRARTADDIIRFLTKLKAVTDNLIVQDAEIELEDFKISVALHILGLTDENLALTGTEAIQERRRRFREWVAQHTSPGPGGKPVLRFNFTTSIADNGIFSNVILQGYDRFWLHEMAGIGQPKAANSGFWINLLSGQTQNTNLRYRRVAVTESGTIHLRARSGCILDYRLIHPAALLGLEWPAKQPPESMTTDFKAYVNNSSGERTAAFLGRPVSATDWQFEIFAGAPELGLDEMDLQQLTDIELYFSTTRASRSPGEPKPSDCVRVDF